VSALYNEIDRYCCDWLQNLMDAEHITPGRIDDRSIADLSPDDVRGYERVHFFAGIGGWELALQMSEYAGPVWTGSCPCQPFSAAGKGKASGDERHLWPEWFRLISAVRPPIIFGEQVEAAIGWGWLDLVYSDLEAEGYALRSTVLPACSVGAPHIRQRLWFVADSASERNGEFGDTRETGKPHGRAGTISGSADGGVGHADKPRSQGQFKRRDSSSQRSIGQTGMGHGGVDYPTSPRLKPEGQGPEGETRHETRLRVPSHGCWQDLIWLPCTDGKQRPTQSGIFPLAHGVSGRVAKLRAAGNAIVPQVAAEFIKASMT
jgi:DNA (cytosine-5)-methyltransferase 1